VDPYNPFNSEEEKSGKKVVNFEQFDQNYQNYREKFQATPFDDYDIKPMVITGEYDPRPGDEIDEGETIA